MEGSRSRDLIAFIWHYSLLQQTHLALIVCDHKSVTVALHSMMEYPPKWCSLLSVLIGRDISAAMLALRGSQTAVGSCGILPCA